MDTKILNKVTQLLPQYHFEQINATLKMLDDGNTVPFIARYRKERTGTLDEVQIREIESTYQQQTKLSARQQEVLNQISAQEKLTPALKQQILTAETLQVVEDLYLPYKQKRRTKATIARERGLQPFADYLLEFPADSETQLEQRAATFISDELVDVDAVFAGVGEILTEQFGDAAQLRQWTRDYTWQHGVLTAEVKDETADADGVYRSYYDFKSALPKLVSHRILAINRGEAAGVLKVSLVVEARPIEWYYEQNTIKQAKGFAVTYIKAALADAYKRFIGPAIERELRRQLKEAADDQAIAVFGENYRHLLLQAPLKGKIVLGFDPGFRTGSKLAVVDATGKFLDKLVIYPHHPADAAHRAAAMPAFIKLIEKYQVEMIAIGNGTASRESEEFVAQALKKLSRPVYYVIVSEAGASVYSASDIARAEFPQLHVEERSAISIARRLQDPLAELVKIDPQSVGVGQYQHDVNQKQLREQLEIVIGDVVNQVGVNVNTASPSLLTYVSGLNATIANNIVIYRNENGPYQSRAALKKVPRLGPKAFEQSVGFLRIIGGKNPLDNTDIHPESYALAKEILKLAAVKLTQLGSTEATQQLNQLSAIDIAATLASSMTVVKDLIAGLAKPGRDLRDQMPAPLLRQDILKLEDLTVGMALEGTVRNVVDFGAFVDIGLHQDGLVHLSHLRHGFVKKASDVVAVGDIVQVWVLEIDEKRQRVGLTMVAPTVKKAVN